MGLAVGLSCEDSADGEALAFLEFEAALPGRAATAEAVGNAGRLELAVLEAGEALRATCGGVQSTAPAAERTVAEQIASAGLFFLQRELRTALPLLPHALHDTQTDGRPCRGHGPANKVRLAIRIRVALVPEATASAHAPIQHT